MKRKFLGIATAVLLLAGGSFFAFGTSGSEECPLKETAECPLVTPTAQAAVTPGAIAELPPCCQKK